MPQRKVITTSGSRLPSGPHDPMWITWRGSGTPAL